MWTLHGLHALSDENVLAAAYSALGHPAAGVRKAALQVLPRTAASLGEILEANLLSDANLNVRLAAFLAISEMPPSGEAGARLYAQSQRTEVTDDLWLPEALLIAASRHRTGFMAAYAEEASEGLGAGEAPESHKLVRCRFWIRRTGAPHGVAFALGQDGRLNVF